MTIRIPLAVAVAVLGTLFPCWCFAAEPAKATHVIEPVLIEVASTKPAGDAWDTGIGAFTRPDPQVTLLRNDKAVLQEVIDVFVAIQERRIEDLGEKKAPPQFKTLIARTALQSLRCGASVEALQDEKLDKSRARIFADTNVAKGSILAKLSSGELKVAVGDKVTIFVNDVDVASHDLMGEHSFEITKDAVAKGELEFKFDSVESIRLKLKPIAD